MAGGTGFAMERTLVAMKYQSHEVHAQRNVAQWRRREIHSAALAVKNKHIFEGHFFGVGWVGLKQRELRVPLEDFSVVVMPEQGTRQRNDQHIWGLQTLQALPAGSGQSMSRGDPVLPQY